MPSARTAKRCHFALTALYGALSMFVFLVPFVFINYSVTFQMTTLATVHLITGILVGMLVLYAALKAVFHATRPHPQAFALHTPAQLVETLEQRQRRLQALADATMLETYRRMSIAVTVIVLIALVAIGFYLYNLIYILAVKCPCYAPQPNASAAEHPHTQEGVVFRGVDRMRVQHADTLDVLVTLNDAGSGTQHVLLLKYNVTAREIQHRSAPREAGTWAEQQRQLDALEQEPVCSANKYSRFYHLQSEIEDALTQRLLQHQQQQSVVIKGYNNNVQTNVVEDQLYLELMARYICRNEYGFAAGLVALLLGVLVLNFITMGWFLGLRRGVQRS